MMVNAMIYLLVNRRAHSGKNRWQKVTGLLWSSTRKAKTLFSFEKKKKLIPEKPIFLSKSDQHHPNTQDPDSWFINIDFIYSELKRKKVFTFDQIPETISNIKSGGWRNVMYWTNTINGWISNNGARKKYGGWQWQRLWGFFRTQEHIVLLCFCQYEPQLHQVQMWTAVCIYMRPYARKEVIFVA